MIDIVGYIIHTVHVQSWYVNIESDKYYTTHLINPTRSIFVDQQIFRIHQIVLDPCKSAFIHSFITGDLLDALFPCRHLKNVFANQVARCKSGVIVEKIAPRFIIHQRSIPACNYSNHTVVSGIYVSGNKPKKLIFFKPQKIRMFSWR